LFSPDGKYVATGDFDDQRALLDIATGKRTELGADGGTAFSADGRFLVTEAKDKTVTLYAVPSLEAVSLGPATLSSPSGPSSLSSVSGLSRSSPDGRWLPLRRGDGAGVLYDLSASPASQGPAMRADVCAASGDALRPFEWKTRTGEEGEPEALYGALRGRPWNPCDWRGLAAGPEGWSQWLRRLSAGKTNDYLCGEIDAAGTISAKRVGLCRAAGVPERLIAGGTPEEPAPPS
jgi:hypothetical protein